jgi:hypothetical protein
MPAPETLCLMNPMVVPSLGAQATSVLLLGPVVSCRHAFEPIRYFKLQCSHEAGTQIGPNGAVSVKWSRWLITTCCSMCVAVPGMGGIMHMGQPDH